MKKKLLALAVAGAFVAPVAMADNVAIYGVMNGSVDNVSVGKSGTNINTTKVSSHESHIGFKGSEDLGNGTSGVFQIESQIELDNTNSAGASGGYSGNTGFAGRNTFVGLSGSGWGSLLLGTNDTPYKASSRKTDLFDSTIADNRSLMGGVGTGNPNSALGFDRRANNSVTYNSPDLSGLKLAVQYQAGAELASAAGNSKGSAWSLAANYATGPISALVAYETHDIGTAGTGDMGAIAAPVALLNKKESSYKFGAGYGVDQFAVNLVYEKNQDSFIAGTPDTDLYGHKSYYVSGRYNVSGSDAVKLAYTHAGSQTKGGVAAAAANTGAKQISVGYDHGMGKRTTVYALWTKLTNEANANYGLSSADVSTSATAGTNTVAPLVDSSISAVSVGIKHTF